MQNLKHFNKLNQTGIQFYIREITFIDKTKRMVFGYYLEAPLQTICRHTKPALNVYIIERFKKKQGAKKTIKGTYNIATKSVILQRKNSTTGLTHEIGHYFGLLHPHRHYDKGKSSQEPVNRSRTGNEDQKGVPLCEERGDLLSDTPAEPKLTFLVDNNCQFTGGSLTDAWGDNYQSDVNNIMSYPTNYICRDSFTMGQKAVMLYSASVNKYAKYWNTEDQANHKYFFDKNEPNDVFEMSSAIESGVRHEFNFHKIFMGKNEDRTDTCDWQKFEVKMEDKRNVRIIITPDKENRKPISAILYDKNSFSLSKNSSKANEPFELKFSNVVSDWYYIKINTSENNSINAIDKYSIEIKLE
ncbi:MAG: hypothetical protein P1P88_18605, partial [Bacteroidales bacterium]|nr:hypothetical protein [Bacteroidales bacterium]